MTDVKLYQAADGGEIDSVNGQTVMSDGLETAAFLSLFGGNEDDSGDQADDLRQWWANFAETDPARRYRSETQSLLDSLPLIPSSLRRIEEAAARDLAWMVDAGIATFAGARATIPALNTVDVAANIEIDGETQTFTFRRSPKA